MRVRLGVTFQSVFYAPYFVAVQRGLFEREGIELPAQVYGDGRLVQAGLERGELDIGIGGIMRSLELYDRGAATVPIHFARINDRDGFFLLGRTETFDWPDLLGKRLILFAEAPTPWYVLRGFLIERGLDPDRVQPIAGLPADRAAAAFRAGQADFLETPAPVAEELVRAGEAVILRSMAQEVGPLPYSSYCARPDFLDRAEDAIAGVVRAHVDALNWMRSVSGAEIWAAIRPAFADGDPEILRRAVERYQQLGVWSSDATLPRAGYDRLAELLHKGGLISRIAPYELVCRDDLAQRLTRE